MSRILITGGTGSLGHALVSYYLKETDHRLIVFSRDELKQAQMREEFTDDGGRLDFFLGDVRDRERLERAFRGQVDVVIHAAALKRVDATARDPDELLKTNILGTRNVLLAAAGTVKRCVLISTDKACHPSNAYGVSKAMAEHLFTAFNVYGKPQGTRSAVVRYGNVLGSRGSVVTVWRERMNQGLPFPLTDPRMTRFMVTMERAVQMIQTTLTSMDGGEIFVPRLDAFLMMDLGRALRAWPDEENFALTGLRPGGEKLHETLVTPEEMDRIEDRGDYLMIRPHGYQGASMVRVERWVSEWAPKMTVDALKELI